MIIIDEAHFLRLDGLETLRRIYDATKCPLVLVGKSEDHGDHHRPKQDRHRPVLLALRPDRPGKQGSYDDVKSIVLQNGVELKDDCLTELHKVANMIGALRIMTKLFPFAWTIANRQSQSIALEHILTARKAHY